MVPIRTKQNAEQAKHTKMDSMSSLINKFSTILEKTEPKDQRKPILFL